MKYSTSHKGCYNPYTNRLHEGKFKKNPDKGVLKLQNPGRSSSKMKMMQNFPYMGHVFQHQDIHDFPTNSIYCCYRSSKGYPKTAPTHHINNSSKFINIIYATYILIQLDYIYTASTHLESNFNHICNSSV